MPRHRLGLFRPLYLNEAASLFIAAVATAFALGKRDLIYILSNPLSWPGGVLIGALMGVIIHELAHKYAAIAEGCRARYVLTPTGLAITLLSGLIPSIAIIMPGYVAILCYAGSTMLIGEEWIAAAGPIVNVVLSAIAYAWLLAFHSPIDFLVGFISVNAWIALFNLIPIPPLDGYKILKRRPIIWILLIAFPVLLLFYLL
ncbi:MAG: M50 family metallopeptidase [Crenarchaeota archaeon]|nr:M50 family metallopeptidase [Thermoproteota archaeon]